MTNGEGFFAGYRRFDAEKNFKEKQRSMAQKPRCLGVLTIFKQGLTIIAKIFGQNLHYPRKVVYHRELQQVLGKVILRPGLYPVFFKEFNFIGAFRHSVLDFWCRMCYYPEFDSKQKQRGPQTIGTQGFAGL